MRSTLLILLSLFFTSSVYARQYMQCSGSEWNNYVINLDGDNSTFFHTTGVHLPGEERTLLPLRLAEQNKTHHKFVAPNAESKFVLLIKNDDIGVDRNRVIVQVQQASTGVIPDNVLRCFSVIYQD